MHKGPVNALELHSQDIELARPLAPEDLRRGDYVAILNEVREYPSFFWCLDSLLAPPAEPVRIVCRTKDAGTPLRVKAVCLPFVFVKPPCGVHRTLDMRQCNVVRLQPAYARLVWKSQRKRRRSRAAAAAALLMFS